MNFAEYCASPQMNWSSLKEMAVSPKRYKWRTEHPPPDKPDFKLGRAIHCAWLEPGRFETGYVVKPEGLKLGTHEGKDWKILAGDREVTTAVVPQCVLSLKEHTEAAKLLKGCRTEETIQWVDQRTGVACKARHDIIGVDYFADLKKCRDLAWFEKDAAKFLYHGQIAWYLDGAVAAGALPYDAKAFIIAVEDHDECDVIVYPVGEENLNKGRALYRRLLDLWVQCTETGLWPGRSPGLKKLELPVYAEAGMHEPEGW